VTTARVGIIDYGAGNLRSVANAIAAVGGFATISSDRKELANCPRLILPGVGAFGHGMKALAESELDKFLVEASTSGTEILGICLGMQMLAGSSSEFGHTDGLKILPGSVAQLKPAEKGQKLRLPNVGWLGLSFSSLSSPLSERVFAGVSSTSRFYFIHSFAVAADNPATLTTSEYCEISFASTIANDNVLGMQFHPEKSGPAGLALLKNFIS